MMTAMTEENHSCEDNNIPPRSRMKKRSGCVFETSKTWNHLTFDGGRHEHNVTAHWEGLLTGKLVVLVDGEVRCIYTRDQQDHNPMDPYGHISVDGHELEFFPTTEEWSTSTTMNLEVDGHDAMAMGVEEECPIDIDSANTARTVAHQVPAFHED